jgi:hypothetical protein
MWRVVEEESELVDLRSTGGGDISSRLTFPVGWDEVGVLDDGFALGVDVGILVDGGKVGCLMIGG